MPEVVAGGQDTAIWKFSTEDGKWHALRLFRAGQSEGARREQLAMQAAAASVPVPAIEAAGEWESRPVVILSWCAGAPLLAGLEKKPWLVWKLGRLLGETQAAIHRLPAPAELAAGAPDYWLRRGGERAHALAEQLRAQDLSTSTLVHMDYHPLNVLADGSTITGVIDWPGAAAGDCRADLAFTTAILQAAPIPPDPLRPLFKLARGILYKAWRRGYEDAAGLKINDAELAPFLAWAGTVMLDEAEPRAREGRPWPSMSDLKPIEDWAGRWKKRAGLS